MRIKKKIAYFVESMNDNCYAGYLVITANVLEETKKKTTQNV